MVREIYLSWRKGTGARRHLVGILERTKDSISFKYLKENVPQAKLEGFRWYPEFPDINKTYDENIMEILSIRLIPQDRPDRSEYLRFWEADNPNLSAFDVLALTQGKLATDNFEFLADFPFEKDFRFVTDLARLSYTNIETSEINVNDMLTYQLDNSIPNHDMNAIKILKNGKELGHIKKVHNRFFRKAVGNKLDLSVKALNKNGIVKAIYILVKS